VATAKLLAAIVIASAAIRRDDMSFIFDSLFCGNGRLKVATRLAGQNILATWQNNCVKLTPHPQAAL
jgi:hypothetical protein